MRLLAQSSTVSRAGRGSQPRTRLLLQLSVLWRIPPGNGDQERAARILDLVVDGLRTRPPGAS
jgi:hypothetical protein